MLVTVRDMAGFIQLCNAADILISGKRCYVLNLSNKRYYIAEMLSYESSY